MSDLDPTKRTVAINDIGKFLMCCDCPSGPTDLCTCDRYTNDPLFICQVNRTYVDNRNDPFTSFSGTFDRFVDVSTGLYRYSPDVGDDSNGVVNNSLNANTWYRVTSGPGSWGWDWWPPVSMREGIVQGTMSPVISATDSKQYYQLYSPNDIGPTNSAYIGVTARCGGIKLEYTRANNYADDYPADPYSQYFTPVNTTQEKNYTSEFYSNLSKLGYGHPHPKASFTRITEASNTAWSQPLDADIHDESAPVCKWKKALSERVMPNGPYAKLSINFGGDVWNFPPSSPDYFEYEQPNDGQVSVRWRMGGLLYGAYSQSATSWGQDNGPRYDPDAPYNPNWGTDFPVYVHFSLRVSRNNSSSDWNVTLIPDAVVKYLDADLDFPAITGPNAGKLRRCHYAIRRVRSPWDGTDCGPNPGGTNMYTDAEFTGPTSADLNISGTIWSCADGNWGTQPEMDSNNWCNNYVDSGRTFTATITFTNDADANI